MDYIEDLPPVIRILLDEDVSALHDPSQCFKFLNRLIPELKKQAEWTLNNHDYIHKLSKVAHNDFVIVTAGSLDPLAHGGKCGLRDCRIETAIHFARTVGLYADVVTIADTITSSLSDDNPLSGFGNERLANDILVIKELEPLIRAGIVRFRPNYAGYCKSCHENLVQRLETIASDLMPEFSRELSFEVNDDYFFIKTGKLLDETHAIAYKVSPKIKTALETETVESLGLKIFEYYLMEILHNALIDINSARKLDSTLFSSSRFDLLTISSLSDEGLPQLPDIENWENVRSIELPWVKDLNVEQVVRLRNEVGRALPRFREKMNRAFTTKSGINPPETIAELRENAVELASELSALDMSGERRFRNITGTLGITISVYGFASNFVPPSVALGSLITLLGFLHSSAHNDEAELKRMQSLPAYVLLKAKEISKEDF